TTIPNIMRKPLKEVDKSKCCSKAPSPKIRVAIKPKKKINSIIRMTLATFNQIMFFLFSKRSISLIRVISLTPIYSVLGDLKFLLLELNSCVYDFLILLQLIQYHQLWHPH